jgi:hypothetical protein
MGNSHKNLLLRNHWINCNQTLVEWSLDGPLPNLCPVIPTSSQDGRQAKNRKKGGWNLKKIFSSETTEPISTKLFWNDPWVVGPSKDHSTKVWLQLIQWFLRRRFLCEFPIGFYVKLSSAMRAILVKGPLWNYWANLNQTFLKWSLGGPLPKLCPAFHTSDQDGHHSRT